MTDSPVFWFDGNDPALQAASKNARDTFRYYWREQSWELRRIVPGLDSSAVKLAFTDPLPEGSTDEPVVEHMWISDVTFDGRIVRGVLMNAPNQLRSVRQGDDVELPLERVGDWMYAYRGRAFGAHTVNLMRARMSAAERKQHDAMWGLDFGDPATIRLVPSWTGTPGFFGKLFGAKEEPVDPDAEHPMSVNMSVKYREQIATDRSILDVRDDQGLAALHHLALAGSADGVKVALEFGADRDAVNVHGQTALEMAKAMGWPNVVALLG